MLLPPPTCSSMSVLHITFETWHSYYIILALLSPYITSFLSSKTYPSLPTPFINQPTSFFFENRMTFYFLFIYLPIYSFVYLFIYLIFTYYFSSHLNFHWPTHLAFLSSCLQYDIRVRVPSLLHFIYIYIHAKLSCKKQ